MEHPEQWEILRDNPVFLKRAVEELLRYDGSVKSTVRWAKKDVMVGDKLVKQGERLLVSLSGANRDPLQFENPDTLDVTRDPNLHVAFAHGIHVCLGASLARMEAEEAFAGLIKRITCPKVDEDAYLNYYPSVVHRALKNLPVTFHAIK